MVLKLLEAVVPESLVMGDPVAHWAESCRDELVTALAAVPLLGQEAGIEQDPQVLGDCRAAHFEVGGDVADRAHVSDEQIQHLTARTMANRGKYIGLTNGRQDHGFNMRKQLLTCQAR